MKIGIVTIYKCYNYGSFYQAYGLQRYLEDLGHEVSFLPVDFMYNKKYRLRKQFNRDIKRDIFSLKLCLKYMKDWKFYNISSKSYKDYDIIIIGSDEIWNINNRTFLPAKEYYGLNLPCKNVFTYASCVGRSKAEDFSEHNDLLDGIKGIKAVSARDEATEEFLKEINKTSDIQRVLDPSFLADWSKIQKSVKEKNYILVYTYDGDWGFSEEYIKSTKEFAKKKGLPLVSVGFRNTWCDKWVAASPREFLGYLKNADYVVTDTFHGTVMSIQYGKQFVSMGKGKAKVESVLYELDLSDRIFDENNGFDKICANDIDYGIIGVKLNEKIDESKEYITGNIK